MKVSMRKTTRMAALPTWMALFLLLTSGLLNGASSETATVASAIDMSGEIKMPGDGTTNDKESPPKTKLDLANALLDWLVSEGGSVNLEKISIQQVADNDPSNLGIIAVDEIEEGEELLTIPASFVLARPPIAAECQAALTLQYQITNKGNESDFAPYLNYLGNLEEIPSIPSTWSPEAKNIMNSIQGPALMPREMTELSFFELCTEYEQDPMYDDTKLSLETAFAIALTRSWDEKFVPILDMFNHNPHPNIATKTVRGKDGESKMIVVSAKYNIAEGSELYTSYSQRSRDSTHNVATLLMEYGVVEDYPQRWVLPTPQKRSNIEQNEIPAEIEFKVFPMGDEFGVQWLIPSSPLLNPIAADHLKKELDRLQEMRVLVEESSKTLSSQVERETILDYYQSLLIAYTAVIGSIEEAIELSPVFEEDEGDNFMACSDFDALIEETNGWEHFDGTESSHQEIDFYYNGESRDACLYLENYLHACVSNRPHYHEVFVHYPAYFLEKVERVLFIGGGDSMVLHEVLKYDEQLELVVGLELDQHVVRATFSHIGTQPHFHNDKVEWWFGDAAETLNVLPTEYYGTFDLVVVDILSEVAEALEVTDDVTIMEAAMMLMKPNGIIIKNEDEGYVPGSTTSAEFTKYTADVMYYDVPVYCLQTFVIGSNAIDFSTASPIDHKTSNFYIKGVDEFQSQFDTWYTTGKERVAEEEKKVNPIPKEKSSASAMVMIIEAEEIAIPVSTSDIREQIHDSITAVGFTVKETFRKDFVDGFTLVLVLEEAIVSARCQEQKKYCAIDVQFWKSTHVAESLKKELLSRLKSEEHSVFRVIATGVVGVEEHENDSKVGPPSTKVEKAADITEHEIQTTFQQRKNPEIEFKNATFEDYDSESALSQWNSQEIVGVQTIAKYDLPYDYRRENFKKMVEDVTYVAIEASLRSFRNKSEEQIMVETFDVGDGIVVVGTWTEGTVVGVWDGKQRFDVNMFSLEESARASHRFITGAFRQYLERKSADVFPRGTGRVISFPSELVGKDGERAYPFWALQDLETDEVDGDEGAEL